MNDQTYVSHQLITCYDITKTEREAEETRQKKNIWPGSRKIFMRISNSTAACFVGVIVKQSWGTGLYQSASSVPGSEKHGSGPRQGKHSGRAVGLRFQNRFEGFMCCFCRRAFNGRE